MRFQTSAVAAVLLLTATSPAFASGGFATREIPLPPQPQASMPQYGFDPAAKDAWLADCRHRLAERDPGRGGALIGGVVGGLAGNRIAGKGNRTVGTVVGAAAGAVAGAVIDRAEDAGRNRDECEAYLDDYLTRYSGGGYSGGYGYPGAGYAQPAYGYGYGYGYPAAGCCMMAQPVMMVPVAPPEPDCVETVEYIYEDVPAVPRPAKRYVPRPKPAKIIPDKRVPTK